MSFFLEMEKTLQIHQEQADIWLVKPGEVTTASGGSLDPQATFLPLSVSHQRTFPDLNVSHVGTTHHLPASLLRNRASVPLSQPPPPLRHTGTPGKPQGREAATGARAQLKRWGRPSQHPKKSRWRVGRRRLCNSMAAGAARRAPRRGRTALYGSPCRGFAGSPPPGSACRRVGVL